jgi:hypothetical protein
MMRWLTVAALAMVLSGCATSFRETHFFKSEVAAAPGIPNYFRLTVEGSANFSSARYISGYFDEDTVNAYFNEYTQPKGAALLQPAPTAGVQPVQAGLRGTKLVMILSSNSDEVASQIGALAASKQFTASLAGLVARDQFTTADQAEQRLQVDRARAKTTAALADKVLTALPAGTSAGDAERQLMILVNTLAIELGYQGSFADLAAAAQWLEANRSRLQGGR